MKECKIIAAWGLLQYLSAYRVILLGGLLIQDWIVNKLLIGIIMMAGASILVSACGIKHDLYIEDNAAPQESQVDQA